MDPANPCPTVCFVRISAITTARDCTCAEQGFFTVDNDVIQTFSTDRTDHALDVSSLPRRPRGAEDFFDVHDFELLADLVSVDPVAVSQEIFWCAIEGKRFDDLLRGHSAVG